MSEKREPALLVLASNANSAKNDKKLLMQVGANGETMLDFAVHDAIKAGFRKIIIVLRREIERYFRETVGNRLETLCHRTHVEYVYAHQELEVLPAGHTVPVGRKKPWGSGQAVLCCRNSIREPFGVIRTGCYYGQDAFYKLYNFLKYTANEHSTNLCMTGFALKNTLSSDEAVTRSICEMDQKGYLSRIVKVEGIIKDEIGIAAGARVLSPESPVSVNMWGFTRPFAVMLEEGFERFLANLGEDALSAQYQLADFVEKMIQANRFTVRVLIAGGRWFEISCREETDAIISSFAALHPQEISQYPVFGDLTMKHNIFCRK